MILTILLVIIYLAFISLGLPDSLLGSAWPSMYLEMGAKISYAGIVSMTIAGGTIISSIFSAKLIRRFGSGKVTVVSVTMTAFALLGFSFSTKFYHLCIFAIPLGLGAGSVDAALNNFVALRYQAKHMNWLHSFWGIGAMTGPIIMSYYLERGIIFRQGYQTIAIIQFALVLILILSLPLWKKVMIKKDNLTKESKQSFRLTNLLTLPGTKAVLIALFCYCAIEATMGLWGASYVVLIHGITPEKAAKWASLFYFGITFGRMLSGFITYKLNCRQMIYLGLFFITLGIILIILPFAQVSLISGFVIVGLGCAPVFPSILHQTPDNFGKEYSQSIMGLQMACAYVGSTFMPPLFGFLANLIGYNLLPIYIGALLILMFLMIKVLNQQVNKKRLL